MAVLNQKDITLLFVGKSSTAITTGGIATLNNGEIGIFTPAGVRLTEATASTTTEFILAQGKPSGTPPMVSPILKGVNVRKASKKARVVAVEQVDYIGYNTSAYSIDDANNTEYFVRLNIDQSLTSNHGGQLIKHGVYKSSASATQVEIANGITDSLIKNVSREPEKLYKVERVTDSSVTTATSGTLAVVNGSPFVTASIDMDNGGVVVGDYLAISGIAYKVVAINVGSAQVAQLDTPYQGVTAAAIADASVGFITAANAATGAWGVKITAKPLAFSVGKKAYSKTSWNLTLSGFGTTVVTNSAAALLGSGTYEQAQEIEFSLRGNNGEIFKAGDPMIFPLVSDLANEAYDIIHISTEEVDGVMTTHKRRKNIMLLIPNATPAFADSGTADDLTDVLEVSIYGSATGALAI